mgnify:CR=1 FL=1
MFDIQLNPAVSSHRVPFNAVWAFFREVTWDCFGHVIQFSNDLFKLNSLLLAEALREICSISLYIVAHLKDSFSISELVNKWVVGSFTQSLNKFLWRANPLSS